MLLADHHKQNVARIGRLARPQHHRVRSDLSDHVYQSDHLRRHELRVPTGVQEPVDVQELAGTATDQQGYNQKTVRAINARLHGNVKYFRIKM